jgi:hypothetical protein
MLAFASRTSSPSRRRLAAAALCVIALAVGVASPVEAAAKGTPASVGPGSAVTDPRPAGLADALRCANPAYVVHFKRHRAVTAVAIGMAESYCTERAKHRDGPTGGCPNGSVDRGLFQINSCYHPEVSRHCAFKATCNTRAAKRISDHGKNWTPWSVYNSGVYKQYLEVAKQAVDQVWGRHRSAAALQR